MKYDNPLHNDFACDDKDQMIDWLEVLQYLKLNEPRSSP